MGLLALKRLMSMQRERRRRQIEGRNGSIASLAKRMGSPRKRDDESHGGKRVTYSGPDLPEDIWRHIHSLVPMQDSARAACVSRTFLHCWRCKVDKILKNHSDTGLKTITLKFRGHSSSDCHYFDSWLQMALTPAIEELSLVLSSEEAPYNFPCSLLSDRCGNSVRYLHLVGCAFRPAIGISCLKSLTTLHLWCVRISGRTLGCLLSSSLALEQLDLRYCDQICRLKIPSMLQRLSYLEVFECHTLQVIESEAPNISKFHFHGKQVQLSLGESLQLKNLRISHPCVLSYACATLPSSVPNLETLTISSSYEINTPMIHSKFVHLKHLSFYLSGWTFSPTNDYFSLVSFLGASPSLETFLLTALLKRMEHDSIFEDPSHMRRITEHRHDNLKSVKIIGFSSAKSLVELTVHILENAASLECLTLDTTDCAVRCSDNKTGKCAHLDRGILMEAPKSLLAIRTYIEAKAPSTVELNVLEPCSRCHAFELQMPS